MALIPSSLYLISVGYHIVAIIPAKDALQAINKYIAKTGFASDYRYFCSHLMTTATTIDTNTHYKHCFAVTKTKTAGGDILSISSQLVVKCNDIFSWADTKNINNPLFVRPTIEEVRNCAGFSRVPMYKLRKFCI